MHFKSSEKSKDLKAKRKKLKTCLPSIISKDLKIIGDLESEGIVEVEGSVEGNVTSLKVNVRHSGSVEGNVIADSIDVSGEVKGSLKARNINISKTARVSGVLMYESISIMDGAFVDGQFKVTQDIDECATITKLNFKDSKKSKNKDLKVNIDEVEKNETENLTNVQ